MPRATPRTTASRLARVAALVALAACSRDAPTTRDGPDLDLPAPNVVLIIADDLGYTDLGCFGARDVRTPAIDALAAEGAILRSCYASAPACTPTRAALITGRFPARCGLEGPIGPSQRDVGLPTREPNFVRVLRDRGYRTGLVGKWHLGYAPHFHPNVHGFEEFFGVLGGQIDSFTHAGLDGLPDLWSDTTPARVEGYATDLFAEHAERFLRRHAEERFFLTVAFTAPHAPYQDPDRPEDVRDTESWMHGDRATYVKMVERMDAAVARITATLEELGLADDTLVVFTNDNGGESYARNAPLDGGKGDLHEGGIRVPGVVRWPGRIDPGTAIDRPIVTHDLATTFLALAGADPGPDLDGVDLRRTLLLADPRGGEVPGTDGAPPVRRLFWRMARPDRDQRAVRDGRYKYLRINAPRAVGGGEFLYDVVTDPGERVDLAGREPEVVRSLREAVERWDAEMATENPRFHVR